MSPASTAARTEWSRRLARALVAGGYVTDEAVAPLLGRGDRVRRSRWARS